MAEEIRANEPTDAAQWAAIERRRKRVLVIVGGTIALALLGAGLAAALLLGRSDGSDGAAPIERVSETSASIPATGGAVATSSADATVSGDATVPAGTGVAPPSSTTAPPGVCMVSYRRGGWVYVAKPDGSAEVQVFKSTEGVFALSPDSTTLAVVESGSLWLADVATGKAKKVGAATQERPSWWPDSSKVAYTRNSSAGPQVRRVKRAGSGDERLFEGLDPAVSPAGDVVVGRAPAGTLGALIAWTESKVERFVIDGQATDVATDGGSMYFVQLGNQGGRVTLRRMDLGGHGNMPLADTSSAGKPVSYHDLCVSADGKYLAYAEYGDDGYSRLYSMTLGAQNKVSSLSIRRDDYPLCWGCDGRLYFIEGNALQGEATKLMAVRADGIGRVTIVEGATR